MPRNDPLQLFGEKELERALLELSDDSALRVMRPSISKALVPVRRQAKQNVEPHKRSGALLRSISKKAGGRRGRSKAWGKIYVKSKPQEWNGQTINPSRYAHFLEFGTRSSRPYPFMRQAMSTSRAAVKGILIREGWANMAKFSGRLRKKYNTMRALKTARRRVRRLV